MNKQKHLISLSPMQQEAVEKVRCLEQAMVSLPQVDITTEHTFHAGMYARSIILPKGVTITGAQIRIPTIVIISGDVLMYGEKGAEHHAGYTVLCGEAGRKQAFHALQETSITMIFPTQTTTIEEAEKEFTHEYDKLCSNKEKQSCQERQQQPL